MVDVHGIAREQCELALILIADLGRLVKDLAALKAEYDQLGV